MAWRRTLLFLHRDVGYLSTGLVIAYAVSGFAVNHRQDWNYNQSREVEPLRVGTPTELLATAGERPEVVAARVDALGAGDDAALIAAVTRALGRATPPRNAFWRGPDRLSLFYGAGATDTVDYHPSTGMAERTILRDRPLFRDLNFLHLNEGRRLWTYVADLFAVALAFLAVSGAVMIKGRLGLRGRGGVLIALGVVVPFVALLLLRWT
jgi:hypothetical protein